MKSQFNRRPSHDDAVRNQPPMNKPTSFNALEKLGRERLSQNFFMREFLHSEIANFHGIANIPEQPDLAIKAGSMLCEQLLEPLNAKFGRIVIRSGYRSPHVNQYGNEHKLNCANNEKNRAAHIWDMRDAEGNMGATACIVIPAFSDYLEKGGDWRAMAWWIHDTLPYSRLFFFPALGAFNIQWREKAERRIDSYIPPKGCLTKRCMSNHNGDHSSEYALSGLA